MKTFLVVVTFLSSSMCVTAQRFAVGVKVGGVPTPLLQTSVYSRDTGPLSITDQSKHWTVGPSFEFEFWKGLGVEVDALYRHIGYDGDDVGGMYWIHHRERDSSWEFPILGKYRFLPNSPVHPFVVSGYALRRISGSHFGQTLKIPGYGGPVSVPDYKVTYDVNYSMTHGFVIGGGVDFKFWHLQISPEFRFTNWNRLSQADFMTRPVVSSFSDKMVFAMHNQAEILVGISFR